MSAAVWGEVANAALQATSAYLNYDSQRQANLQNLRNSREQREFEREMSNTAVQRRKIDIERAGGNPALAFVNGSEATTPVYTPARIEAAHVEAPRFNTAALIQQQMAKAQIANTEQDTRLKRVNADIAEKYGLGEAGYGALEWQKKWAETGKAQVEVELKKLERDMSAAKLQQFQKVKDDLATEIENQAKTGTINLKALENIARLGGVEGTMLKPLISLLLQILGR